MSSIPSLISRPLSRTGAALFTAFIDAAAAVLIPTVAIYAATVATYRTYKMDRREKARQTPNP